jgi:GT2 family glycosyltransferase
MEEVEQQQAEQPTGPRVTVIIASFHRGAMLRKCLEALARSRQPEALQVIVLDIGTHDTTSEMDLDYPEFTFLRMPRNFGATKALNIGIRSAKADTLCFLDPAVEVQPDTILRLADALESTPEAGAVCPLLTDASGSALPQVRKLPERDVLSRLWQDESAIPVSPPATLDAPMVVEYPGRKALLIRLAFLKGMNYFDEHYGEWGADLELAFQIRHAGKKALLIPQIRVTDHSASEAPMRWTNSQKATLAADRLNGVAHFLSKRAGFFAGLLLRIQAALLTLVRALTFQDPGYNWSLLTSLLGGQKIDGSQGSL